MATRQLALTGLALLLATSAPAEAGGAHDPFAPNRLQTLLDADEAFRLLPVERDGDRLRIEWDIAPGYFVYRDRIGISVAAPAGVTLGTIALPQGLPYHDAVLGDVQIYRNSVVATVAGAAKVARLHIHFQGCADAGVCFPPQDKEVTVTAEGTP